MNKIILSVLFLFCYTQINSLGWQQLPLPKDDVPDSIVHKTDEIIRSKVGAKYFSTFIKFDAQKSGFRKSYRIDSPPICAEKLKSPHYYITYKIYILDMGEDVAEIDLISDTVGNIISDCYINKIPECPDSDCWDYFPVVKKEEAIKIAKHAGLEDGIRDWDISFSYNYYDVEEYTWVVKNTLHLNDKNSGGGASGKTIVINAIDGTIVGENGWFTIP